MAHPGFRGGGVSVAAMTAPPLRASRNRLKTLAIFAARAAILRPPPLSQSTTSKPRMSLASLSFWHAILHPITLPVAEKPLAKRSGPDSYSLYDPAPSTASRSEFPLWPHHRTRSATSSERRSAQGEAGQQQRAVARASVTGCGSAGAAGRAAAPRPSAPDGRGCAAPRSVT